MPTDRAGQDNALCVLQVSTSDRCGGAEKVAWELFEEFGRRGVDSFLAVGYKKTQHPRVFEIPNESSRPWWSRGWRHAAAWARGRGERNLARFCDLIGSPIEKLSLLRGLENFSFPGTRRLIDLPNRRPDVVHCHNLHRDYFDLRVLPWLSQRVPVLLTLHDAWLMSGHCAHSFDCERWKSGCGNCPDLTIYPDLRRDATAQNWERKQRLFRVSRLYVSTPCQWLMEKLEQSMLAPAVAEARVIPHGIDLSVFRPAEKSAVRDSLGIARAAQVLLFAANGIRQNIFKDYQTIRAAVARAAPRQRGGSLLLLALGEEGPSERVDEAEIRFVPFQTSPERVAAYYQAADLYLHAARAESVGLTILEALACGTPVVATAVGGIPEQVKGLRQLLGADIRWNRFDAEEATGVLVPQRDATGMAAAIEMLLDSPTLRRQLSANAVHDAQRRFDQRRQADDYLNWYSELLHDPGRFAREAAVKAHLVQQSSAIRD